MLSGQESLAQELARAKDALRSAIGDCDARDAVIADLNRQVRGWMGGKGGVNVKATGVEGSRNLLIQCYVSLASRSIISRCPSIVHNSICDRIPPGV